MSKPTDSNTTGNETWLEWDRYTYGLEMEILKLKKNESEKISKIQKQANERCEQMQRDYDEKLSQKFKSYSELYDTLVRLDRQKDALEKENKQLRQNLQTKKQKNQKLKTAWLNSIDATVSTMDSKIDGISQMLQSTNASQSGNPVSVSRIPVKSYRRKQLAHAGPRKLGLRNVQIGSPAKNL